MSKIKVAHYIYNLKTGGTQKNMQLIIKYSNKDIFDIIALTEEKGEHADLIRTYGVKVYIANGNKIAKFFGREKPLILHLHGCTDEQLKKIIKIASAHGTKVIVDHMNFGSRSEDFQKSESEKKITYRLMPSMFLAMKYMYLNGLGLNQLWEKCRPLYYPLEVHEHHKKENTGKVIGRMGRQDPNKWDPRILYVFSEISKKFKDARMVLVGFPKIWLENIEDKNLLKRIKTVDSIPSDKTFDLFYNKINILTYYANSFGGEGFGYGIAEGMAAKKPVIVNSTPLFDNGQIEVVENNITGFCVASPEGFAEATKLLLKNKKLANKMAKAGFERAKEKFNPLKISEAIEKLYVEGLEASGLNLSEKITDRYKNVKYTPSKQDMELFIKTYDQRLLDCFGMVPAVYLLETKFYKLYYRLYYKLKLGELQEKIGKSKGREIIKYILTKS